MRKETFDITKHEKYGIYTDIREIRNDLAKEILANYPLHRSFVSEFSREYYISKKTMENQVAYAENMPCLSILSNFNGVLLDEDWGIFKVGFNICYTPST